MGIVATAVKSTEKFLKPITESWKGLGGRQKAGVVGGGAALVSGGALAGHVLSGGKNNTTINKLSADDIANTAFMDELNKLASEKGLKKLIKKIHKTHPEAFEGISAK